MENTTTNSLPKALPIVKKIVLGLAGLVLLLAVVQIINAEKYQAVVRMVAEAGQIGVNPTTEVLDFGDLSKNATAARFINVTNEGRFKVSVAVFKFGSIAELIKVDKPRFVVSPGGKERIRFELYMPPSATRERLSGWVWVFKVPLVF